MPNRRTHFMKLCARHLTTLSAGMQQRVAFARARAIELPQPRLPKDPESSGQRTEACRAPALGAVVGPVVG
jgi:ABC-type histidine transport system ATPase subunit